MQQVQWDELVARLRPILARHGAIRAIVFGSWARGEVSRHSDLDLIVVLETDERFLDRYDPLLREITQAVPGRDVDLLIYTPQELAQLADRPLIERALREGKTIYELHQEPASERGWMMQRESNDLQQLVRTLSSRFRLLAVYAFGSRATEVAARTRGEPAGVLCPASDVDIGVLPAYGQPLSAQERVLLAAAFEDTLDVGRVDLVILPEADPFLAANVIRGERLYARDPDEADEYELYVLRRAGDLAPLERERIALILGEQP
jgi:predicted nucleotidyltransferase